MSGPAKPERPNAGDEGLVAGLTAGLAAHLRRHGPLAHAVILEALADFAGYIISRCRAHGRDDAALRFLARVIFHADHYTHYPDSPHPDLPQPGPRRPRTPSTRH